MTVLAVGTQRVPLRAAVNPFNYFGFFTMQGNIAAAVVVLVRGATDGWVPYAFLDPASGYLSVFLYVAGIAVSIAGFGALVILISRSTGSVSGLAARVRRTRG